METINSLDQKTSTLEVTKVTKTNLKTTSSWTEILSIFNFIGAGFLALTGIALIAVAGFMPDLEYGYMSYTPDIILFAGILYLVMGIILFFPALYLFRFSQKMNKALSKEDTPTMDEAFKNMKSYWKFSGILYIIMVALCVFISFIVVMS
jgi:hypothetical protein